MRTTANSASGESMTGDPSTEPVEAKHFVYLDNLRRSGRTNMWGAGPYLEARFRLGAARASKILGLWMKTYDGEKSAAERAAIANEGK